MDITVLVYFLCGLGLTNHILRNLIVRAFRHLSRRRLKEEHLSQYEEIQLYLSKLIQKNKTN